MRSFDFPRESPQGSRSPMDEVLVHLTDGVLCVNGFRRIGTVILERRQRAIERTDFFIPSRLVLVSDDLPS